MSKEIVSPESRTKETASKLFEAGAYILASVALLNLNGLTYKALGVAAGIFGISKAVR